MTVPRVSTQLAVIGLAIVSAELLFRVLCALYHRFDRWRNPKPVKLKLGAYTNPVKWLPRIVIAALSHGAVYRATGWCFSLPADSAFRSPFDADTAGGPGRLPLTHVYAIAAFAVVLVWDAFVAEPEPRKPRAWRYRPGRSALADVGGDACNRFVVGGTTSSGKSTLALGIASALGLPFVDMDVLYWLPAWTPRAIPEFRRLTHDTLQATRRPVSDAPDAELDGGRWAISGNYTAVRPVVWAGASPDSEVESGHGVVGDTRVALQCAVWLDYPLHVVAWRLTCRIIRRARDQLPLWHDSTGQPTANSNRENGWIHLRIWSDQSLYYWLATTFWVNRRAFPLLFALPEHRHVRVLRFDRPADADRWLKQLRDENPHRRAHAQAVGGAIDEADTTAVAAKTD